MIVTGSFVPNSTLLDEVVKTLVTPLSPIFSGLWRKKFATKWRGTAAELNYDSYWRNSYVVIDTGIKGSTGTHVIEFSTWQSSVSRYALCLPNIMSYKVVFKTLFWQPSFVTRNSTVAGDNWSISATTYDALFNNFAGFILSIRSFSALLLTRSITFTWWRFNSLSTISNFEPFSFKIFYKFVNKFDLGSAGNIILNNRLLLLRNILITYSVIDRSISGFFNGIEFLSKDFLVVNNFFVSGIRSDFLKFATLSRRNVTFDDVKFSDALVVRFSNVLFLFNFFLLATFFLTKRVVSLNFVNKLMLKLVTWFVLFFSFKYQLGNLLNNARSVIFELAVRLHKRFFSFFSLSKFSFLSLFCVLKAFFFNLLPTLIQTRFERLSLGLNITRFGVQTLKFKFLYFLRYTSNYKILSLNNLFYAKSELAGRFSKSLFLFNTSTLLSSYFVIRRRWFFFGQKTKRFKFKSFNKYFKPSKNRRLSSKKFSFLSLTAKYSRLRKKRNMFSYFIFPLQKKQFLLLFFWSFNFFNFFIINKKATRGFSFIAVKLAYFYTIFLKFLRFYSFNFKFLKNSVLAAATSKAIAIFMFSNYKLLFFEFLKYFFLIVFSFRVLLRKLFFIYWNLKSFNLFKLTKNYGLLKKFFIFFNKKKLCSRLNTAGTNRLGRRYKFFSKYKRKVNVFNFKYKHRKNTYKYYKHKFRKYRKPKRLLQAYKHGRRVSSKSFNYIYLKHKYSKLKYRRSLKLRNKKAGLYFEPYKYIFGQWHVSRSNTLSSVISLYFEFYRSALLASTNRFDLRLIKSSYLRFLIFIRNSALAFFVPKFCKILLHRTKSKPVKLVETRTLRKFSVLRLMTCLGFTSGFTDKSFFTFFFKRLKKKSILRVLHKILDNFFDHKAKNIFISLQRVQKLFLFNPAKLSIKRNNLNYCKLDTTFLRLDNIRFLSISGFLKFSSWGIGRRPFLTHRVLSQVTFANHLLFFVLRSVSIARFFYKETDVNDDYTYPFKDTYQSFLNNFISVDGLNILEYYGLEVNNNITFWNFFLFTVAYFDLYKLLLVKKILNGVLRGCLIPLTSDLFNYKLLGFSGIFTKVLTITANKFNFSDNSTIFNLFFFGGVQLNLKRKLVNKLINWHTNLNLRFRKVYRCYKTSTELFLLIFPLKLIGRYSFFRSCWSTFNTIKVNFFSLTLVNNKSFFRFLKKKLKRLKGLAVEAKFFAHSYVNAFCKVQFLNNIRFFFRLRRSRLDYYTSVELFRKFKHNDRLAYKKGISKLSQKEKRVFVKNNTFIVRYLKAIIFILGNVRYFKNSFNTLLNFNTQTSALIYNSIRLVKRYKMFAYARRDGLLIRKDRSLMRRYWAAVNSGAVEPLDFRPKRLPVKLFSDNPLHFEALEGRIKNFKSNARFVKIWGVRKFIWKKIFLFASMYRRLKFKSIYYRPSVSKFVKLWVSKTYVKFFKYIKRIKPWYNRRRVKRFLRKVLFRALMLKLSLLKAVKQLKKRKFLFISFKKLLSLNLKTGLVSTFSCLHKPFFNNWVVI